VKYTAREVFETAIVIIILLTAVLSIKTGMEVIELFETQEQGLDITN